MTFDNIDGKYHPHIQPMNQQMGKINFLQTAAAPNVLGGGSQGFGQYLQPNPLAIPLSASDWKKLSRETQIKILDELEILAK